MAPNYHRPGDQMVPRPPVRDRHNQPLARQPQPQPQPQHQPQPQPSATPARIVFADRNARHKPIPSREQRKAKVAARAQKAKARKAMQQAAEGSSSDSDSNPEVQAVQAGQGGAAQPRRLLTKEEVELPSSEDPDSAW